MQSGILVDAELSAALRAAVKDGELEVTKYLLKNGVQQTQDEGGNFPLHLAAKKNNAPMVALLLEHKADSHLQNKNGLTAIKLATSKECLNELKKYSIEIKDAPPESTPAGLLLLTAIQEEDFARATTLLEAKADPNSHRTTQTNLSALQLAVQKTESTAAVDLVKLLLEHKADRSYTTTQNTPIETACDFRHWKMVMAFAKHPTDSGDKCHYGPAFLRAIRAGEPEVALAILKTSTINKNLTLGGYSALHLAVSHRKNLSLFITLLNDGFDPKQKSDSNSHSQTPIELATSQRRWDFIKAYAQFKKQKEFPLLALKENCISELARYTESLESRKKHGHHARANSMIAAFNALSEEKSSFEAIESILQKGIDAFKVGEVITSGAIIPKYAQPPTSDAKDGYNTIIERYYAELSKLKPAEQTATPAPAPTDATPAPEVTTALGSSPPPGSDGIELLSYSLFKPPIPPPATTTAAPPPRSEPEKPAKPAPFTSSEPEKPAKPAPFI